MTASELSDAEIRSAQRRVGQVNLAVGVSFIVLGVVLLLVAPHWGGGALFFGVTLAVIGCARLLDVRRRERADLSRSPSAADAKASDPGR